MAIRVLLDHGVQQSRIIFVSFLVALAGGLSALRRAFPEMHIVTGAVDGVLAERRLRIGGRKVELAKSRAPYTGSIADLLSVEANMRYRCAWLSLQSTP